MCWCCSLARFPGSFDVNVGPPPPLRITDMPKSVPFVVATFRVIKCVPHRFDSMTSKILIFAGAPESSALNWDSSQLLSEFQDAAARVAGLNTNTREAASSAPEHAAWRSLSLDRANIHTDFSQRYSFSLHDGPGAFTPGSDTEFPTSTSLSFIDGDESDRFYEHSLAIHQDLTSSQLVSQSSTQISHVLGDDTTSFMSDVGTQTPAREPLLFRGSDVLGDLKNIPPAASLIKIQPQTMTCNLLAGIISISQPRAIKTRWGSTKHLVEVLVGDETRAGFTVTYWLPSDSIENSPLAGLRPQDIVLMQNVALNVFTNKVYGSSLRKNLTKMYLLYRAKLDAHDTGGHYSTSDLASATSAHPQLEKTRRVRDWVRNFVGHGSREGAKMNPGPRWNRPPADDTQLA